MFLMVALLLLALAGADPTIPPQLAGCYTVADAVAARADVDAALDRAVGSIFFALRPFAKGTLAEHGLADVLLVDVDGDIAAVTVGSRPRLASRLDRATNVNASDGPATVTARVVAGSLVQTARRKEGVRTVTLTPTLTGVSLRLVLTSPELQTPLDYTVAYRRSAQECKPTTSMPKQGQ